MQYPARNWFTAAPHVLKSDGDFADFSYSDQIEILADIDLARLSILDA